MTARNPVAIASIACVLMLTAWACAATPPAPSTRDRMVGSWELAQRTVSGAGGEVVQDPVLGAKPIGRLFYSADGHMSLQMMRQGRASALTTPDDPAQASNARIVTGYDSYFGTFTIDEAAGTVTHHIEGSLFPEDLGKDFTRRFRLDGDRFELSFTSKAADGSELTRTLAFQRSR
jgi:hypothetical protein